MKVVGFIIGAALVVAGVLTGNVGLIIQGTAMIVAQAAVDLTMPKTPAREASEMSIALGEQPRCAFVGEGFTPGSLVDAFNFGGKYGTDWEVLVIRLADHKIHSLTGFYVNGDWNPYTGDGLVPRYDDQLQIFLRTDTTNQALPSIVTANGPGWASGDIGASGADVIVAYKADKPDDKHPGWPGGRPRFGFVIKGKFCYDPRKDSTVPGGSGAHRWEDPTTWEWSDNAVICRYNVLARGVYANDAVTDPTALLVGRGLTAEEAPPENIFAAANLCDVDAAGMKPFLQPTTTIIGLMGLSFGGSYCAHWNYAGGQIEWWDVRTRSRLGVSSSPGTLTGGLMGVSLARSGTAYCVAPKLPSGHLFYIVTEPMKATQSVDTLIAGTAATLVDVNRALDTIDGVQFFGAYHTAAGYLADTGSGLAHVSLTGSSARDFCVDDALHPWMASQPTGTSSSFTLTDLKTSATTTFVGAVSRSGPSDLRVAYCADGGNFLVSCDGHFYIIDKASMTVTSTGTAAFSANRPDTQQVTDRTSFWDGMDEYSLKTGTLIRSLNPLDWVATIDAGFTFDAINHAIWSQPTGTKLTIRFLDRSGPWRVAGPIYANQPFIDVEEMFAAACAGNIITHEGSVELEPAQAKSIVASFTDDDLLSASQVSWNHQILPASSSEDVNSVVANYVEPDQKWNDHAAPVLRDTADIIADGKVREATIPLRLVRYLAQALRVAEIARRLARLRGRATVKLGPRFCFLEAGDWVQWTSASFGFTLTFRIDAANVDDKWQLTATLREINASVFADDAVFPTDLAQPTTSPPTPDIGAPGAGTWTLNTTQLVSAGASVPALTVTGASDDDQAQTIVVEQWKSDGVTDPVADPDAVPWTMVGSYAPGTTEVPLPTPTGGAVYYAAVSYVVSGVTGDRLVLGPVTAGDLDVSAQRRLTIDTVTGTTYALAAADDWHHKRFTNAGAITVTVPTNATAAYPIGARTRLTQAGAGQFTLAPDGGVTLNSRDGALKSAGQNAVVEIEKVATDAWDVLGDVTI